VPEATPRYIYLPLGGIPGSLAIRLREFEPYEEFPDLDAFREGGAEPEPGWVLVPPGHSPTRVLELLLVLSRHPGPWAPLFLEKTADGIEVISLSPGYVHTPSDAAARVESGDERAAVLSYRRALPILSDVRHDINNALTAGFAEVQLMLMDRSADDEETEYLRTIESQFRRIRDLIARISPIRPPTT
jgi:signal transduction histidine kinase